MQTVKKILPLLLVLVLSIVVCFFVHKQYNYATYEKDLDNYNTKITSLKGDINAYNRVLSTDVVSEDLNYIKEDGNIVVELQNSIIKEYKVNSKDVSKRDRSYETKLKKMIDTKEKSKWNTFCYPWSEKDEYKIVFLSDFYTGKSKVKVSWEIFEKDELKFIVKADYDVVTRNYSKLVFSYVDDGTYLDGETGNIVTEEDDVDNYEYEDPDDFSDWDENDVIGDGLYDDTEVE